MNDKIKLFENQRIRTAWDEEKEEWYFSVVDVVGVLTDSVDPTAYWRKLKQRLKAEGNETVTNSTVDELNAHVWGEEFHACVIEKAEFESIWETHTYDGALK